LTPLPSRPNSVEGDGVGRVRVVGHPHADIYSSHKRLCESIYHLVYPDEGSCFNTVHLVCTLRPPKQPGGGQRGVFSAQAAAAVLVRSCRIGDVDLYHLHLHACPTQGTLPSRIQVSWDAAPGRALGGCGCGVGVVRGAVTIWQPHRMVQTRRRGACAAVPFTPRPCAALLLAWAWLACVLLLRYPPDRVRAHRLAQPPLMSV
jgi:hypothetical protein